jgi:hypothetical protein
MDIDRMLYRVTSGERLSERELAFVRGELARGESSAADRYTLVHILWTARDRQSRELLRACIDYGLGESGDEGMVRRIAVQALAALWPELDTFSLAEKLLLNDPSVYVRMAAASAVGHLGNAVPSARAQAARLLLRAFNDHAATAGFEWEASYDGLLNLAGVPLHHRPLQTGPLSPNDVRQDVIDAAVAFADALE